jgi:glycine hydroxymethyltransferase
MIIAGYSAYSHFIDWGAFRKIADEVGAVFLVDAAHILGLIAGSAHPNPVPHADIVTATTHKALRGPRGGLILSRQRFAKDIDKGVFPGVQGGPINNQIAAKALCFKQAARAEFKTYANQIVRNAKVLAGAMDDEGLRVVGGGTENHMFLVDLRSLDPELTGKEAAQFLDEHGVTLNRNSIPFDPRSPFITSGLRMGTPSVTSAGMMQEQMVLLGKLIVEILRKRIDPYSVNLYTDQIRELADAFPAYPADFPGHV